jgi:membrane protein required for colicin V production
MNSFDLIILAVMLVFTAIGAWRGLVHEIITVLTWVLSILLAWLFAGSFSGIFKGMVDDPSLRLLLAFMLIFIVVFILGMVASWFIHKHLPGKRGFRIANRTLGGVIGAARGAVVVIAFFLIAGLTPFPQRSWWREASFAPYFERAAVYVAGYMPRDIARSIRYG